MIFEFLKLWIDMILSDKTLNPYIITDIKTMNTGKDSPNPEDALDYY